MRTWEADALDVMRAAYAELVIYSGAGGDGEVFAIRSDMAADPYQGMAGKGRRVTFEIAYGALPVAPTKSDTIHADETTWRVIDIDPRDDVVAYVLTVET